MVTPGKLNRRSALFNQLATMIEAGVPLPKALEMVGRNRSSGIPQKFIQRLTFHLNEGHTFTDSMQLATGQARGAPGSPKYANKTYWLSDFDVALLSAGEESGRLDTACKLISRYYSSRAQIMSDTIKQLIVPMVTLHVALMVFPISFLVQFVLGILNNQYATCLPFIIEKIAAYGFLYFFIWFLMYTSEGNRAEGWRFIVEAFFNVVPWLRQAIKYLAIARLAMALDSLLNAGVPVVRAWELSALACGSPRLKRDLLKLIPQLETGVTPAEMVTQIRYFPEMFTQLVHTGEISGRQDEMLPRLHTYFEQEGFNKLQTFSRVLGYVIYFTIAGCVGYEVIHFWLGYFNTVLNSF